MHHLTGATARLSSGMRVVGRSLALISSVDRAFLHLYIAIVALTSLLPIAQVWLTKRVVDQLVLGQTNAAILDGALVALLLALIAALQPQQHVLQSRLESLAAGAIDRYMIEAGAHMVDLTMIERPAVQDEIRLVQDNSNRLSLLMRTLQRGLGNSITLIGFLLLIGQLHPLLPLLLFATSVPDLIAGQRLARRMLHAMVTHSRSAREMDYCLRTVTDPRAAKELRAFGLGDFFLQRFRERRAAALAEVQQVRLADARLAILLAGLHALALAGSFWFVAARASAGVLTLGDMALYLSILAQAEGMARQVRISVTVLYESLIHLRRLFEFADRARPGITLPADGGIEATPLHQAGVNLSQIIFQYPEGQWPVLEGIDAMLPAGSITALVGANGAGKSTIVKLLSRMYDPNRGTISWEGDVLSGYNLSSLRQQIAAVYQDAARFPLSLRENIALGATTGVLTDAQIAAVARWAGLEETAAELERGYDTLLTRTLEGGVDLSGGQWQKVALARAYARNAGFLLLDEPMAALDAEAEAEIIARLRAISAGKTALLISHRFSTVRMADQILVIEDGRIVEAGTHATLVAQGGRYAQLFAMQAEPYR